MRLRSVLLGLHASHLAVTAYNTVSLIVVFSPSLIGSLLFHRAKRQFDTGLDNEQWTKQETDQVLRWVESPRLKRIWLLLFSSIFIGYIALFSIAEHLRWPDYFAGRYHRLYLMFFVWFACTVTDNPQKTLAQIRKRLRPPGVPIKGWVGTIQGIHSDHWGGRETPRTESTES